MENALEKVLHDKTSSTYDRTSFMMFIYYCEWFSRTRCVLVLVSGSPDSPLRLVKVYICMTLNNLQVNNMITKIFPFPIGLGSDLCHIPRIRRLIIKDPPALSAAKFIRRILHPIERSHAMAILQAEIDDHGRRRQRRTSQPLNPELHRLAEYLAGR